MKFFQKFSYNNSHLPQIKRFVIMVSLIALGLIVVGTLQLYLILDINKNNIELTMLEELCSYGCLGVSFVFAIFLIIEVIRHFRIIKIINKNNYFETLNIYANYNKKLSIANIYRFIQYIIFTFCAAFVVAFDVYCILSYKYYKTINYFFPITAMLLLASFYSLKMVEHKYQIEAGK